MITLRSRCKVPLSTGLFILSVCVLASFGLGKWSRMLFFRYNHRPPTFEESQVGLCSCVCGARNTLLPSRRRGRNRRCHPKDAAYYETLVHPAMLAPHNPRRIAIIDAGAGDEEAILREVLKHKTVEEVVVLGMGAAISKDLRGNTFSSFDDPPVIREVQLTSFLGRFQDEEDAESIEVVLDVIFLNTADLPVEDGKMDSRGGLYEALSRTLSADGILVAPDSDGDMPSPDFVRNAQQAHFKNVLQFDNGNNSFLLAMKDRTHRASWHANEAEWNYDIHRRLKRTQDGELPLEFFDSATMMSLQFPSRLSQDAWCRQNKDECVNGGQSFDVQSENVPVSSFRVQPSLASGGGRGIFSERFITKGSYLGLEECVHGLFVPPSAYEKLYALSDRGNEGLEVLSMYLLAYGWTEVFYEEVSAAVDPGIMTFANHGCNGTYNAGTPLPYNEFTIHDDEDAFLRIKQELVKNAKNEAVYNPYAERENAFGYCNTNVALRNIAAKEEVLWNYLVFNLGFGELDEARELYSMCTGTEKGEVTRYEERAQQNQPHDDVAMY